jgi:hypothetical protein
MIVLEIPQEWVVICLVVQCVRMTHQLVVLCCNLCVPWHLLQRIKNLCSALVALLAACPSSAGMKGAWGQDLLG